MTWRMQQIYRSMLDIATRMANEEDSNIRQDLLKELQKEMLVCYKIMGVADKLGGTIDVIFERRRDALEMKND